MDAVYFELNNWFAGRDYPNAEPFNTWCDDDMNLYLNDENFVKENGLCVVCSYIDMSVNWCITAPMSFVESNCPDLLSDKTTKVKFITHGPNGESESEEEFAYSSFLRHPDEDGIVYGKFGDEFLKLKPENVGITFGHSE